MCPANTHTDGDCIGKIIELMGLIQFISVVPLLIPDYIYHIRSVEESFSYIYAKFSSV